MMKKLVVVKNNICTAKDPFLKKIIHSTHNNYCCTGLREIYLVNLL